MPAIPLETRPHTRAADVERISITTIHLWIAEGQLTAHVNLLRNEARALGEALIREANRPFDHHQREEEADAGS